MVRLGLGHYQRAWGRLPVPADPPQPAHQELAFYRCHSPRPVTLAVLVTIEENFQASKGLTGLDEHQARRWASWHRWVTLAMLAAAILTIAAAEHARQPSPADQIPLTRNEIAHLLSTMTNRPGHDTSHRLRWARWRRRHQHRARLCHYKRQAAQDQVA